MTLPTVVVERLSEKRNVRREDLSRAFEEIGLSRDAASAKTLLIKPNLTYPVYKKGVTTRMEFVEEIIDILLSLNRNLTIYVAEGEGGYNSFSMTDAFRAMGFLKLEKKYPQVKMLNLSKIPAKEMEIETPKGPYRIALPGIFFDEIDFSISCPLPKVHCMTKITLSYKNQWGCLPDIMRLKNHYMFDLIISKIAEILKFRYAVLDGKFGLDSNGPMVGDPVEVNWLAASNSLGAFDMVVSEMMGFDWQEVGHLKTASDYGFMPKREDVRIIGNIGELKRKFVLKRTFWNYPALAAFHSKHLTHFVYLSRWAKPVHDLMYAFRKRPIQP